MPEPLRILLLGANGRLGRALHRLYALPDLSVTAWGRSQLDLTRPDQIPAALDSTPFDLLINAAGLTNVDACEVRRQEATLSNAVAPGLLAEYCAAHHRRFIHISSDYVFPGIGTTLLSETAPTGPRNHYGQTKLDGEVAALTAHPDTLVVRVSWLFGPDKPSFPDMILRTAREQDHVAAVNDKWSSPSYSDDLAHWLLTLIRHHPQQNGLLHLCNEGAPTWQEYGQATLDIATRLGLQLKAHTVTGHTMQGFEPFKATRPPHTALDTSKFQALTGIQPRPWQDALEAYLRSRFP
jgi:dTDP-4-dehydrorhamnose reductase